MVAVLASVIAAVFGLAAASTLASISSFAVTVRGLGFPRPAARGLALAVIAAEAIVFLLYASSFAPWLAGGTALGLCLVFAGSGLRARLGHLSVSCSCFGAGSSAPLGLATVGRALALAVAVVATLVLASMGRPEPRADITVPAAVTLLALAAAYRMHATVAGEPRK
jgi:hypothetical protein